MIDPQDKRFHSMRMYFHVIQPSYYTDLEERNVAFNKDNSLSVTMFHRSKLSKQERSTGVKGANKLDATETIGFVCERDKFLKSLTEDNALENVRGEYATFSEAEEMTGLDFSKLYEYIHGERPDPDQPCLINGLSEKEAFSIKEAIQNNVDEKYYAQRKASCMRIAILMSARRLNKVDMAREEHPDLKIQATVDKKKQYILN